MIFRVLTLFPEMIDQASSFGVIGQARKSGRITLEALSPRAFTSNVHQTIDDRPFGGGDGMIMMAEPASQALEQLTKKTDEAKAGDVASTDVKAIRRRVLHLSPRGQTLTDKKARELAKEDEIILISSRYGGIDQRFLEEYSVEEISIGDYVISGGELAALVVIDAVARLLPGVLGNEASPEDESFGVSGLLEHPQYTRPREWRGREIPQALLSGDHAKIQSWKDALSLLTTLDRRPELAPHDLPFKKLEFIGTTLEQMSDEEFRLCGLHDRIAIEERLAKINAIRGKKR